ncbi:hypothetical protein [Microlunatus flavus]|uniref:Uncharacterized protein n=1 Tax=Microlunatus flavus TaxID=1036181 RepID=A0A1H9FVI3_9ACTN|nr:hypothetical protein [Microlunatus flavus]SEQ41940.1 hypothetical protein SAMN05421756_103400 [Microlunatus flavus]
MALPFLTSEMRAELKRKFGKAQLAYQRDAAALGVGWSEVKTKLVTADEILKLTFVRVDCDKVLGPLMVLSWRQLSGYQHGHISAIIGGSMKTAQADIPGGAQAQLTIDDSSFGSALQSAALMQVWAVETFIRRCRQPSSAI